MSNLRIKVVKDTHGDKMMIIFEKGELSNPLLLLEEYEWDALKHSVTARLEEYEY